jgi:hypothetical protein
MADEGTGGVAGSKLPETEGLIPGRGESVGAVRRDDLYSIRDKVVAQVRRSYAIRDDMGVTVQTSLWIAVRSVVTSEVPDDQRLVSRSRQEHVGAAVTLASPARRV